MPLMQHLSVVYAKRGKINNTLLNAEYLYRVHSGFPSTESNRYVVLVEYHDL